jgi:hypothetical protein
VANLESQQPGMSVAEHPKVPFALDMRAMGYFVNLRIRDYRVGDLGPDDYLKCVAKGKKAEIDQEIVNEVKEIERRMTRDVKEGDNVCRLGHVYPEGLGGSRYYCSIFRDDAIKRVVQGIPGVTACTGGRVHVKDLGDIYLGRYFLEKVGEEEIRHLTMLRIDLASPPTGWTELSRVVGDGKPT